MLLIKHLRQRRNQHVQWIRKFFFRCSHTLSTFFMLSKSAPFQLRNDLLSTSILWAMRSTVTKFSTPDSLAQRIPQPIHSLTSSLLQCFKNHHWELYPYCYRTIGYSQKDDESSDQKTREYWSWFTVNVLKVRPHGSIMSALDYMAYIWINITTNYSSDVVHHRTPSRRRIPSPHARAPRR